MLMVHGYIKTYLYLFKLITSPTWPCIKMTKPHLTWLRMWIT
jgi:hypothetical protein